MHAGEGTKSNIPWLEHLNDVISVSIDSLYYSKRCNPCKLSSMVSRYINQMARFGKEYKTMVFRPVIPLTHIIEFLKDKSRVIIPHGVWYCFTIFFSFILRNFMFQSAKNFEMTSLHVDLNEADTCVLMLYYSHC